MKHACNDRKGKLSKSTYFWRDFSHLEPLCSVMWSGNSNISCENSKNYKWALSYMVVKMLCTLWFIMFREFVGAFKLYFIQFFLRSQRSSQGCFSVWFLENTNCNSFCLNHLIWITTYTYLKYKDIFWSQFIIHATYSSLMNWLSIR